MALERQLVITVEIPLLDVTQKFHVKEAISLPVPYHKTNITVEYELEFKNFSISTDGHQYVIFTLEDQINCGKPDIHYYSLCVCPGKYRPAPHVMGRLPPGRVNDCHPGETLAGSQMTTIYTGHPRPDLGTPVNSRST